jgi:hypothetical protein
VYSVLDGTGMGARCLLGFLLVPHLCMSPRPHSDASSLHVSRLPWLLLTSHCCLCVYYRTVGWCIARRCCRPTATPSTPSPTTSSRSLSPSQGASRSLPSPLGKTFEKVYLKVELPALTHIGEGAIPIYGGPIPETKDDTKLRLWRG